ncbi:TPA: class I SAM-dependent methyltransferase [Serratia marcescens]
MSANDIKNCDLLKLSYPDFLGFFGVDNTPPGGNVTLESWIKNSKINKESYLLDLACSTGFSSRNISLKTKCRADGIDISPPSIESANALAIKNGIGTRVKFSVANAESIPFSDNTFTHITAGCCFGFISDKETALKECHRVLRNDGYLCISPFFYELTPDRELIDLVEKHIGYRPDTNRDYDYWYGFFSTRFHLISEELFDLPVYTDDEIELITQTAICSKPPFLMLSEEQQQISFDRYYNTRVLLNEHAKYQSVALWTMRSK